MNKNTIIAFLIILGSVIFFTSPTYNKFYTEKILKKEYVKPSPIKKQTEEKQTIFRDTIKEENIENANSDTIWIENEKIIIGIKEEGAIITDIIMKEYKYSGKDEKRKIDLIEEGSDGGAQLIIGNKRYDKKIFKYNGIDKKITVKEKSKTIDFVYEDESGEKIIKRFSLEKNNFNIYMTIIKENLPGEKIGIG